MNACSNYCTNSFSQTIKNACFKFRIFLFCVTDVHFYTGQQVTQNADIIYVTIRLDPVSMKQMQKATAVKMAPIVPLHMGHMICAALFMISGAILLIEKKADFGIVFVVLILTAFFFSYREVQVMESQGGAGATEGDGQSGQAASTALIEKIVSEEPRWQGNQSFKYAFTEHMHFMYLHEC